MIINWVNKKNINIENVNNKIIECINNKHLTNNGKNVINLQNKIKNIFKLDKNKEVLMVCNGASGIYALISGINIYYNKKIRWITQSFTFPCAHQGILSDSIIIDIDDNMGPDIKKLEELKEEYDGIIITNCFGCSVNIEKYEEFGIKNNKIIIYDNAAAPMTYYKNKNHLNYGNGCMISLHHTKPIGFGEGGFIVFDNKYIDSMKKAICFGYTDINKIDYEIYASNYKMSEIACIYIEEYLTNLERIYDHHTKIIKYFEERIKEDKDVKVKIYKNYSKNKESLLSTIPIIFNKEIEIRRFIEAGIEVKKYYYPLDNSKISKEIYDKIICLPLNLDVDEKIIEYYIKIIKE